MRKIIILLGLAALLLAGCYAGAAGKTEITVYEAPT
jgi:predicted small secreted protein